MDTVTISASGKVLSQSIESFKLTALKTRSIYDEEVFANSPLAKDNHLPYLTFDEEIALLNAPKEKTEKAKKGEKKEKPKTTKVKPMYEFQIEVVETVEEDGKKKKVRVLNDGQTTYQTVSKPKTKWIVVPSDFKYALEYILQQYLQEIHRYYIDCKRSFPSESEVLSGFLSYCESEPHVTAYVSPFIVQITTKIDANKNIESIYAGIDKIIADKLAEFIKNKEGSSPNTHLGIFAGKWAQFVKLLGINIGTMLYYQKKKCGAELLYTALRLLASSTGTVLSDTYIFEIIGFVSQQVEEETKLRKEKRANTPAKKSKKKSDVELPNDVDDEFSSLLNNDDSSSQDDNSNFGTTLDNDDWDQDDFN